MHQKKKIQVTEITAIVKGVAMVKRNYGKDKMNKLLTAVV